MHPLFEGFCLTLLYLVPCLIMMRLAARGDWQSVLVWRDGLNELRRAADVPEISLFLKKPRPIPKPSLPPRAFTQTTTKATPRNDIPPKEDASPIAPTTKPGETDQGADRRDDQKPKKKLTSRLLAVLSFFGIFVAAAIGHTIGKPIGRESNVILGSGRNTAEQIESGLIQAENTVCPTLPKKVDDHTTWVAINHTGRTLQYEYLVDLQWADTTTAHGRLMLTVLGGVAEFERELIRTRTGEGREREGDGGDLGS
jgi:hypothetical protein